MTRRTLVASLLALLACAPARVQPPAAAAAADVAREVSVALERLFDSRPLHRVLWGVEIVHARSGAVLYQRNPRRHFVPASTMKLLVTATALDALGPDYTYRTSVYADGELRDGALAGNLVLYGRGDPNLSGRYAVGPTAILAALADSLAASGLRSVEGRVVADESFFDADYTRPDWEAYDLLWWYAAPVSALSFNDNSIDFTIRPGPVGSPPLISASPPSAYYALRNEALTVARVDSGAVTIDFTREPGTNRIRAYGVVAADAEEETESFSVVNPAAWTGTAFREVLESSGIAVALDSVVVVSDPADSPVDSTSTLLAEHVSPPLERVLGSINQRSQNWHAEQLLKTLGKAVRGSGTFADGIAVERAFLERLGIERDAVFIRDASGLSAGNLVTPHALVQLLTAMLRHPRAEAFVLSLPVSGGEGSLRSRFSNTPAARAVIAKTGSIQHVSSLAGYIVPAPGDTLAFSIVANNHGLPGRQVVAAIDSAVVAVVRAYAEGGW